MLHLKIEELTQWLFGYHVPEVVKQYAGAEQIDVLSGSSWMRLCRQIGTGFKTKGAGMMDQIMTERVNQLEQWIQESDNVVFFGGAGVSTESGIPDFRSVDGLYNQQYAYPPETIISHSFYRRNPEEFYRFYKNKMLFPNAKPNAAHRALAKLEQQGKVRAVITQNIDGLHQAAGSREVLELHGSVHRNYCTRCGKFFDLAAILGMEGVPRCECGGIIKPDVVLYEEGLDQTTLQKAVRYIQEADILIIGGTSLTVYPAAGLIDYYRGKKLVLINKTATPMDGRADLVINEPIGEVFERFLKEGE